MTDTARLRDELRGVIADVEQGGGFDAVCLETIKRVAACLAEPAQPSGPSDAQMLDIAKRAGATTYTHRTDPMAPAVAFGPESWAAFCGAIRAALRQDVQQADHVGDANKMVAPAAPARQALTENQVQDLGFAMLPNVPAGQFTEFARAIERAHGITKEDSNHG